MVGPAGSQEVVVSSPPLRSSGAAFVSGSATRTSLTQEAVRRGFFYRVVPPDAIQARSVANYIYNTLRARNVFIIDDQEAYGVGLSDAVQGLLRARGFGFGTSVGSRCCAWPANAANSRKLQAVFSLYVQEFTLQKGDKDAETLSIVDRGRRARGARRLR
jgi:hypothetical protein